MLVAVSALAYVPLALVSRPGSGRFGPLPVQFCRPLLYAVYFFAGVGIGVEGIDHSLLAVDGPLPRRWAWWLVAALGSLLLWMGLTALTMNDPAPITIGIAADLSFALACATGCLFLSPQACVLSPSARHAGCLSANAYSLYLLHYGFVVWLQYALLPFALFAVMKGAIVFSAR